MSQPRRQARGHTPDHGPRQGITGNQGQPHCADHPHFHPGCATCSKARANAEPYPLRPEKPLPRSFGFKDDLTEAEIRSLNPRLTNLYADDPDPSLSLHLLRLLRRLIWPF